MTTSDGKVRESSLTITAPVPQYILAISDMNNEKLVEIKPDGTVIVVREGADKEAARVFYESLQIQGQTLFQQLAERDQEIERLKSLDDTAMRLVLCHDERDALRAENARLNERLDDALGDYMPVVTERDALLEALQRALADYETMRQERNALQSERDWRTRALAAMYEHHSMTHPNCEMDLEQYNIARAALALCERQQEGEHE